MRRFFRIQLAAWAFLLVVAVLFLGKVLPSNWTFWTSAVFSFINFVVSSRTPPGAGAFVGHFWTLSVEKHFYIILSVLFALPEKRRITMLTGGLVLLFALQDFGERYGLLTDCTTRRTHWMISICCYPPYWPCLYNFHASGQSCNGSAIPGWFISGSSL